MDLIKLKEDLRRLPKAGRSSFNLVVDELAAGYRQLRDMAPSRTQGYLSNSRSGVTSSGESSNRREEHLAVGLFNRKELGLPNGERLRLLDYQFPLKHVRADAGIGKIDLLGLFENETLAVIELKTDGNTEDRRICLVEGLIYAAIVEANIERITDEVLANHHWPVSRIRPRILFVAPPAFWSDPDAYPPGRDFQNLTIEIMGAIPIEISLLCLNDAAAEFGLNGRPASVLGHASLSLVHGTYGAAALPGSGR